jgi:hypothetical protein
MASSLRYAGTEMTPVDDGGETMHRCVRCGERTIYRAAAIVPGNPLAPRGSRGAVAHPQPAWECTVCGYLEAHERRASRSAARQGL